MWSVEESNKPVTWLGRKIILMKASESRVWAWCWHCVSPLWLTPLEVGWGSEVFQFSQLTASWQGGADCAIIHTNLFRQTAVTRTTEKHTFHVDMPRWSPDKTQHSFQRQVINCHHIKMEQNTSSAQTCFKINANISMLTCLQWQC